LLKAEKDELLKRVEEESRKEYTKVHTAKELEELLEKYDMASPVPQKESLIIENTNLSPEASAKEIIEKFNLPISQ
jgi:RNase adaptor protein for sRNA GlmZ degradation